MRKWLIGGALGTVVLVALLAFLTTGVFAQSGTPPAQATPTADDARAAALAANPGATVVQVDQDNENGVPVFEVKLDNGLEVQVDANSGAILATDQEDASAGAADTDDVQDEFQAESGDQDDVQDEFESQADDAQEAPGIEDLPGQ
jgi:hypothetical protein